MGIQRRGTYDFESDFTELTFLELSNKEFNNKYGKHAYTWRGKTILLRNALTLLLKQKNTKYNDKIRQTIEDDKYPEWYKIDANKIIKRLEEFEV